MKQLFCLLSLLLHGPAQAQCLSLKELLIFAEEGFDMPEKLLRSKGFSGVRWRHDDPDIDGNAGAYKEYSRAADAFLIFHPDAHGRLLEELIYRFRSSACVVSLRKQLVAAGFAELAANPPPAADPHLPVPLFSPYDGYFSNAHYIVRIVGEVDSDGKDLHRYTVSIERYAAMREMQDAIDEVNKQVQQAEEAAHRNKKH